MSEKEARPKGHYCTFLNDSILYNILEKAELWGQRTEWELTRDSIEEEIYDKDAARGIFGGSMEQICVLITIVT